MLASLELVTGAAGLAGGILLVIAPDGSLLRADARVLAGTPFADWRVPGVLLAVLVGGGLLVSGYWQLADRWRARELSMLAGAGLVAFEVVELAWLGFQVLQVVFMLVGSVIVVIAWRARNAS